MLNLLDQNTLIKERKVKRGTGKVIRVLGGKVIRVLGSYLWR